MQRLQEQLPDLYPPARNCVLYGDACNRGATSRSDD
jgi:hypothetical protein